MRRFTSLSSLNYFRTAAELESFSKAANQLNVTHGAISRAVRLLEEDLSVKLFERRNRSVFLTESGRKLAQSVAQGLGQIEETARIIQENSQSKCITISCEPTLMMRWLIPRLPDFHASHKDIEIQLLAGGGDIVLGTQVDMAIRRNDFSWPERYAAYKLFDESIGAVCRPDRKKNFYTNGRLSPQTRLLNTKTRPEAWGTWEKLKNYNFKQNPTQNFEHFYFSIQAAVAGLGIAIGPHYLVKDDIESGILIAPEGFEEDGSCYFLLAKNQLKKNSAEDVFFRWLSSLIPSKS